MDPIFDTAPFNSDTSFIFSVSPDQKAFDASFGGLAVTHGIKGFAPIVTRTFSFSVHVSAADQGSEITLFISGFASTMPGANAHLLFSVNDQSMIVDFPENSNDEFDKQLIYKVGASSELRVTVFLLADRDSTSDAQASLNVTKIGNVAPAQTTS
jgi:hypothetical protein